MFIIIGLIIYITEIFIGNILSNIKSLSREYRLMCFSDPEGSGKPSTMNILLNVLYPNVVVLLCYYVLFDFNDSFNVEQYILIVPVYYFFRIIFIIIQERRRLINFKAEKGMCIVGCILSVILYYFYHVKGIYLLATKEDFINAVWITIFIFSYEILKGILDNKTVVDNFDRKKGYLRFRYNRLCEKYGNLVASELKNLNSELHLIVFSIMIYESYNRYLLLRVGEYISFFFNRKSLSLGIMQVQSETFIDNEESIKLGIKKIKNCYVKTEGEEEDNRIDKIIKDYNKGDLYFNEVRAIYDILEETLKSENEDTLEEDLTEDDELEHVYDEIEEYIMYEISNENLAQLLYELYIPEDFLMVKINEDTYSCKNFKEGVTAEIYLFEEYDKEVETVIKKATQSDSTLKYYIFIKENSIINDTFDNVRFIKIDAISEELKEKYHMLSEKSKAAIPMRQEWVIDYD